MELQSENGAILPDHDITLKFADGSEKKTKTDSNGCIQISENPPGPVTVEIPDDPG
jgi:hypothetical protein